jgi:hypothetical protein
MDRDRIKEIEGLIDQLDDIACDDFADASQRNQIYFEELISQSASALRELLDERKWKTIKTIDDLPKKPGLAPYEQIDCLILHKGEVKIRVWNCEHGVWDDEDGDDYFCGAMEPKAYMPLPAPPEEGEEK